MNEVKMVTRFVPATSWRGAGYMVSCEGGPQALLVRSTEAAAVADGLEHLRRHHVYDAELGAWRVRTAAEMGA